MREKDTALMQMKDFALGTKRSETALDEKYWAILGDMREGMCL